MTYASARQAGARSIRPAAATHLFVVGQAVRLRGNFGTFPKTAEAVPLPPREILRNTASETTVNVMSG